MSKKADCIPDTPSDPISSLSASTHTAVRAGGAQVQQGLEGRVAAHPVIVTVSADQGAVKTDVHGVEGGDRLDLGGDEVRLGDAVLLVQADP